MLCRLCEKEGGAKATYFLLTNYMCYFVLATADEVATQLQTTVCLKLASLHCTCAQLSGPLWSESQEGSSLNPVASGAP